jgi:succinyl-diaminopimelate desuccinylase
MTPDPVELTAQLIRIDTCNPPGNEAPAVELLAPLLAQAGFAIQTPEFAPGRPSLVARIAFGPEPPLLLSGHLDTVPAGNGPWERDPLGGEVAGGLIHGRGASDMKGGVAALVTAALRLAAERPARAGLVAVLTAGEETGCQGAEHLAQRPELLGGAGAILVAEPTANRPVLGHKGSLWLKAVCAGRAAHGSMPELGDNAIYKAAAAVRRLAAHEPAAPPHPVLGPATLNVGTISGGKATNVVPDRAEFTVDLRLPPGLDPAGAQAEIAGLLGPEVALERLVAAEALWTEPHDPWAAAVLELMGRRRSRRPEVAGVAYFTDGAALKRGLGGVPALLLGPGEPGQAHVSGECCPVASIELAVEDYLAIARAWCA